jgi:hypothetical protein
MTQTKILFAAGVCAVLLSGCGSQDIYTKERFDIDSPFQMKVEVGVATACESAKRALLGQGYLIDRAESDQVKARKAYKTDDERSTFIEMNVVCVIDPEGSTLYANAMLASYDVRKTGGSASVGVKAIGSVSLPFGQSADSMVKVSDETINDKGYYKRFFTAVDHILSRMQPDMLPVPTVEVIDTGGHGLIP